MKILNGWQRVWVVICCIYCLPMTAFMVLEIDDVILIDHADVLAEMAGAYRNVLPDNRYIITLPGDTQPEDKHPNINQLLHDAKFRGLPPQEQVKVISGFQIDFDVMSAKKAGYSLAEIDAYLASHKTYQEAQKVYDEIERKMITAQKAKNVFKSSAFIIIPPVLLYLAGYAVSWVIQGFRQRKQS